MGKFTLSSSVYPTEGIYILYIYSKSLIIINISVLVYLDLVNIEYTVGLLKVYIIPSSK